jgi:hypothetical protein
MYLNLLRYPTPALLDVLQVRLRRSGAGCLASPGTYDLSRRSLVNNPGYTGGVDSQRKIVLFALLGVALAVAAFLFVPQAIQDLAPQLKAARVAIEVAGSGVAVAGPVEVPAGTDFTLHAVLEAETHGGRPLYYTEAPRLVIDGKEVPADSLRRWDRRETVKVLWFTVEGFVPFLKLEKPEQIERFRLTEFLRLDWPQTWAIPGRFDPANDDRLEAQPGTEPATFGTQRYQVRIELFAPEGKLVPKTRFISPGADRLAAEPASFSTAYVVLPGPLATASRYFGLTHIGLPEGAGRKLLGRVDNLTRKRLAYSEVPLLAELIAAAGGSPEDLPWRRVDLEGSVPWGEQAGPGDLLQAGDRWVVLYRDAGEPGRLDRGDLCLDFDRNAAVRPLGQVFGGGGEVDLAHLGGG